MNWIESLYKYDNKDPFAQNGEGRMLEYIFNNIRPDLKPSQCQCIDIGGGDGEYLSNTAHLKYIGWSQVVLDKQNGHFVKKDNVFDMVYGLSRDILSIDIDGNDYWILDELLSKWSSNPLVIIAEFNAMYTDSRTIKYNHDHVWAGDSYYGFTFEAGLKLAEKHRYKVIFQIADMNMIMVRADLIEGLYIPPITYKQNDYFKMSERTDWVWI